MTLCHVKWHSFIVIIIIITIITVVYATTVYIIFPPLWPGPNTSQLQQR